MIFQTAPGWTDQKGLTTNDDQQGKTHRTVFFQNGDLPSWWLCDSQIFHSLWSEAFEQFKYAEAILIANQAESQGLTLPWDGVRLRMALGQKWGTNFIQFYQIFSKTNQIDFRIKPL